MALTPGGMTLTLGGMTLAAGGRTPEGVVRPASTICDRQPHYIILTVKARVKMNGAAKI